MVHLKIKLTTYKVPYLTFLQSTHACRQAYFVLLRASPLTAQVHNDDNNNPNENEASKAYADNHSYLFSPGFQQIVFGFKSLL